MKDRASAYVFALTGLVTSLVFAVQLHDWWLPAGGVCWAAAIGMTTLLPDEKTREYWPCPVLLFVAAGKIFKHQPQFMFLAVMAFMLALVLTATVLGPRAWKRMYG